MSTGRLGGSSPRGQHSAGGAGQGVGALADGRDPGQAADDVAEQGADVVLRTRRGQVKLDRRDGGHDGFRLRDGPAVQRAGIHGFCHEATQDGARALFVLSTGDAHEDLGLGNAARSAILKVMRAVPEPFRPAATATSQRILVDPAGWMRAPEKAVQLGVLQAAVFTGRRLRLRYRSSGQRAADVTERVVDPYGLVCKSGIWYLVADQDSRPRCGPTSVPWRRR